VIASKIKQAISEKKCLLKHPSAIEKRSNATTDVLVYWRCVNRRMIERKLVDANLIHMRLVLLTVLLLFLQMLRLQRVKRNYIFFLTLHRCK
jgi:hypothetical protein